MQAQRLKNGETIIYEMCRKLGTKLRYGLTGTPMQNNHKEIFKLLRLCAHSPARACFKAWLRCKKA